MINPRALIAPRHFSRSPSSRTWETSPICQVCRRVNRSLASQEFRKPSSHSSRKNDSRSVYLLQLVNKSYNCEESTYFPEWTYWCSRYHWISRSTRVKLVRTYSSYCLSIRPCAIYAAECTNTMLGCRFIVTIFKVFRCHKSSPGTFQEAWDFHCSAPISGSETTFTIYCVD